MTQVVAMSSLHRDASPAGEELHRLAGGVQVGGDVGDASPVSAFEQDAALPLLQLGGLLLEPGPFGVVADRVLRAGHRRRLQSAVLAEVLVALLGAVLVDHEPSYDGGQQAADPQRVEVGLGGDAEHGLLHDVPRVIGTGAAAAGQPQQSRLVGQDELPARLLARSLDSRLPLSR